MSAVFNFTFVPWFRSVAPYIHTHRGKTFVVAVAGEAIAAGKLLDRAGPGADPVDGREDRAGHGFRPQVNEQLRAKGHEAKYSTGIRITDEVALDCVAQEAAGQLRYEIEAAFSQGLPNTPMAGSTVRMISGNFITARPVGVVDGVDFQHFAWCARSTCRALPHAGLRRHGADVAIRFFPDGRGLQPDDGRGRDQRRHFNQADKLIFLTEILGILLDVNQPVSEDNPIDTELPLDTAWSLLTQLAPAQRPTDTAFYLQHCAWARLRGRRGAQPHPAFLPWTARCCWRSTCTTASAPW